MSVQEEADSEVKQVTGTDYAPVSITAGDLPYQFRNLIELKNKAGLVLMPRPKVLLVDDDEDEIFLTQKMLVSKDCEVVAAQSVTEALKQIAAQRFDVLITDLHMPNPGDRKSVV